MLLRVGTWPDIRTSHICLNFSLSELTELAYVSYYSSYHQLYRFPPNSPTVLTVPSCVWSAIIVSFALLYILNFGKSSLKKHRILRYLMCCSFNMPIKIINNVGIYNSCNSLAAKGFVFCRKGQLCCINSTRTFPVSCNPCRNLQWDVFPGY